MRFEDFSRRDHLCSKGQTRFYYSDDHSAALIKVGKSWWATSNKDWESVGVVVDLEGTIGPCKSAKDAFKAFKKLAA